MKSKAAGRFTAAFAIFAARKRLLIREMGSAIENEALCLPKDALKSE
jgi:hypothetical protein